MPTLAGGEPLAACIAALGQQTVRAFEMVIVDNSNGQAAIPSASSLPDFARVLPSSSNLGYGGAVNLAAKSSSAEFVAALNDDAAPRPGWLGALLRAAEASPAAGMWASAVLLAPDSLDSAGMLLYGDGSSKQRGHRRKPDGFSRSEEVLAPSGSAALFRRRMLEETGGFDDGFFLYCEDTDLALRAQWAGWKCVYVPDAVVDHRYSASAGRASPLKAYYVERNRLAVAIKNLPLAMLVPAPWHALRRYAWHGLTLLSGKGPAGEFRRGGGSPVTLAWFVVRAHLSAFWRLPRLLRQRRAIRRGARITPAAFMELARRHAISAQEVATL